MVVIAVVIGYLLGVAPFVVPKIIERIDNNKNLKYKEEQEKEAKEQEEIYNEWVYGASKVNQQDLYNEYVTGQETTKGD